MPVFCPAGPSYWSRLGPGVGGVGAQSFMKKHLTLQTLGLRLPPVTVLCKHSVVILQCCHQGIAERERGRPNWISFGFVFSSWELEISLNKLWLFLQNRLCLIKYETWGCAFKTYKKTQAVSIFFFSKVTKTNVRPLINIHSTNFYGALTPLLYWVTGLSKHQSCPLETHHLVGGRHILK